MSTIRAQLVRLGLVCGLLVCSATADAVESSERQSILSLTAELPVAQLSTYLERAVPSEFVGEGSERVCKRLLGIKACGTAVWNYRVERIGAIRVADVKDDTAEVVATLPLSVTARVGVEGDIARVLGISSVPVSADVDLTVRASINANPQGCPMVTTRIDPQWVKTPQARLPGNIKVSLTSSLDDAIEQQVDRLQRELNQVLACDRVLTKLTPLWSECFIEANEAPAKQSVSDDIGSALWAIQGRKLHWSVQGVGVTQSFNVVLGVDANIRYQQGVRQSEVNQRLDERECRTAWRDVLAPTNASTNTPGSNHANDRAVDQVIDQVIDQSPSARLVFDSNMQSNTLQPIEFEVTHSAITAHLSSRYANRNLGKDEGGNEVRLTTVSLLAGVGVDEMADIAGSALILEAGFSALLRSPGGFRGWLQRLFGFDEKALEGVMRVEVTPVWDAKRRTLQLENVSADVTQLQPSATVSLTNAAFVLMQRHVEQYLATASTLELGDSIDELSATINNSLDRQAQEILSRVGGQWNAGTVNVQIQDLLVHEDAVLLKASLQSIWRIRFTSDSWPTQF